MTEEAPQREYALRDVFNGLRWFVRAGCPWRMMPNDLPPWNVVHQQAMRWIKAGAFETMAHDLRELLRTLLERPEQPSAAIYDSRTLQAAPQARSQKRVDHGGLLPGIPRPDKTTNSSFYAELRIKRIMWSPQLCGDAGIR